MRVAVVDIGTNSTRLLVADVGDDGVFELDRRSIVTRLGEGLEATGALGDEPRARVFRVLDQYAEAIADAGADLSVAVLTSAARDAANGAAFTAEIHERFGFDAETISGDEEARLTLLGATANRPGGGRRMVVDIGGGSTELVIGHGNDVDFHVSTQVGVVRHTERHLAHDPPSDDELSALRRDVREVIHDALPDDLAVDTVVAVAGTATMAAAMELELEPYDASRVEGHVLSVAQLRGRLDQLASVALEEREKIKGLDPDRAPTIIAGVAILLEVLDAAGATEVEVSERDILWGRALDAASAPHTSGRAFRRVEGSS
jgi:exopolyphosphatase / guanosine-5'-triphosphate,3'-diphosphate pyrophosphatase